MVANGVCVGVDIDDVQYHGSALDRQTGEVLSFQCRPTLTGVNRANGDCEEAL